MAETPTEPSPNEATPTVPATGEPAPGDPSASDTTASDTTAGDALASAAAPSEPAASQGDAEAGAGADSSGGQQPAAAPEQSATPAPLEAAPENVTENTPVATPAAPPASAEPSVAATLTAPASSDAAGGAAGADTEGGGEWDLLLEKLNTWFRSGRLQEQITAARRPITLVASLVGLVLVLRVYGAVLAAIDSLPLVPGLLELVGVISLMRFSFTRLVRSRERQQLINIWRQRWSDFRGKAG